MSTAATAVKNLPPWLFHQKAYINGEWTNGRAKTTFDVRDPATEEVLGTCPEMSTEDVDDAVAVAFKAFDSYKTIGPRDRSRMLRKLYDLMMENQKDLAALISAENGKALPDAMGEVAYAASFFEWFAEEAVRVGGDYFVPTNPKNRILVTKQPIGVVGILTPWNFPAAMITRKMGAALAAGCTVVIKPASETPFSALAIAAIAEKAGFPKGVINVVTTHNNVKTVGQHFCEHPDIKKISFTGSTGVGKVLMSQSASTLKKLSFELGGNAPFIVFEDANLEDAVDGAITCKFRGTGQTCVCANRIFVHKSLADKFSAMLVEKVSKNFKIGPGLESSTTHGPLISSRAVEKIARQVEDATSKGGKLLHGGKARPDIGPNFFDLTVISDMTTDMEIATEETFGPIAPIFTFESEEEVLKIANSVNVGLAGYFYTTDINRALRVAEKLEVGMIGINSPLISDPMNPFGGVKESGFGREGSKYGIEDYLQVKSVVLANVI
ncbi:hypothetical protein CANCADRAFT_381 [Tortispora caseinolytica NRRL Y-17796]|uniref:Succinate-semialdehyde dehydrogenase n=1 Tax=Tortispora caseinolytica NRRL Y-17796 TaxID=767744 RepID=A0A1E4TJ66_9ASCO|nr:hypothetical protein CANCADRAFT_381 [Tortispora caseinolytica NRRL Y-17796]